MPIGVRLALCAGLFVGNLLAHGVCRGEWNEGLWIGLIAACLFLVFGGLFHD